MQGSLWAEAQKPDEATKAPEFDMSELESLFSAATSTTSDGNSGGKSGRRATGPKSEKVQLIELRRAYNCEIMLTKVKIPLPDLMTSPDGWNGEEGQSDRRSTMIGREVLSEIAADLRSRSLRPSSSFQHYRGRSGITPGRRNGVVGVGMVEKRQKSVQKTRPDIRS
ncbi:hypothetical protein ACLB2K_018270 [Fragaria x ananassa]